jgi:ribosomal protein L30E
MVLNEMTQEVTNIAIMFKRMYRLFVARDFKECFRDILSSYAILLEEDSLEFNCTSSSLGSLTGIYSRLSMPVSTIQAPHKDIKHIIVDTQMANATDT